MSPEERKERKEERRRAAEQALNEAMLVDLGLRVRDLRLERGMTIKELAHSIGKEIQSVHRLEKGGVNPSYLYLRQIAKGLGTTVDRLLEGMQLAEE